MLLGGVLGGSLVNLRTLLIGARVLIGLGTSAGYPSAMLLIRRRADAAGLTAPPGGILGGLVIAASGTAAVGLPLGGVLVSASRWRTTFLLNVPTSLLTLVMTLLWIPRDAVRERTGNLRQLAVRIDVLGIALFHRINVGAADIPGLAPDPELDRPRRHGRAQWRAGGVGAARRTPRSSTCGCWRRTWRSPALLRFFVSMVCTYTMLYGLTQWIQAGRGLSSETTGLLLLPNAIIGIVLTRQVSKRNLVRGPLLFAAVSCLLASASMLLLVRTSPIVAIIGVTIMFGFAGLTFPTNQGVLYAQVPTKQLATASGLFRTWGYLGSIGSAAIISIGFHSEVSDNRLHIVGLVMIGISVVGLLLVVSDRTLMRTRRADALVYAPVQTPDPTETKNEPDPPAATIASAVPGARESD